jgi:hypothetical protein
MKKGSAILVCVFLAVALTIAERPLSVFSQDSSGTSPETVLYKPPIRGAPASGGRVGAAVRGEGEDNQKLLALAPDHVGVTSHRQPDLYWYISKPTSSHIEFTLNDELRGKTVIRADLPSAKHAGIQAIKLSDFNSELSPGIVYQWFVTVTVDPAQPSKDIYNGGSIMYQEPSPELHNRLADQGSNVAVYAEEGLWYDAFAATWKSAKPREAKTLEQQRVSLLRQVGFGASDPTKPKPVLDGELEMLNSIGK